MTKDIKLPIGIIQQKKTSDPEENRRRLAEKIRELAKKGAKLIVNQELHDTLYFCQVENVDFFDYAIDSDSSEVMDYYSSLAKECGVVLVTSLFERRDPGIYHNTAIVFESDGSIAGRYRKMHIPDDPGFYEKFYFTPGDLGFEPIKTSVGNLGLLVCWDQWYPEAARIMTLNGADMLIYPTAIGWAPSDPEDEKRRQREAWITVQRGHAVANGLPVIAVNRTGLEIINDPMAHPHGIDFWGSSFVAGPQGEILYQSPEKEEDSAIVEVDITHSEHVRRWWPFLRDRRIDAYDTLLKRYGK